LEELNFEEISRQIDQARKMPESPTAIIDKCLEIVVEALDAERGAIMLYDPNFKELNAIAVYNIDSETFFSTAEVSLSIIDKVYKECTPLMSYDAISDPRFADKASVIISALRSFLCTPIMRKDGLLGIIYVDDRSKTAAYTQKDLDFLGECSNKITEVVTQLFPNSKPRPIK
jgi:GAF domain-containing protein